MINKISSFQKRTMVNDFEHFDVKSLKLVTGDEIGNTTGTEKFKGSYGSEFDLSGSTNEVTRDINFTAPVNLSEYHNIELVVHFENIENMADNSVIYLYDEVGPTPDIRFEVHKLKNGFQRIRFPFKIRTTLSDFTREFDFAKVTRLRVRLRSKQDESVKARLFYVSAVKSKPILSFNFDDGYVTDYEVAMPVLSKYGFRAVSYIITDWRDSSKMNVEQMKHLYDLGWDIGSHTHTHPVLGQITESEVREDLSTARNKLLEWGFYRSANLLATPYGDYDIDNQPYGWEFQDFIRGSFDSLGNPRWHTSLPAMQVDGFAYASYQSIDSYSVDEAKRLIDSAIENGAWLNLTIHEVPEEKAEWFEEIVQYVHEKTQTTELEVLTPSEVLLQTKTDNIFSESPNALQILEGDRIQVYGVTK